jgi:hypothetical protein
LTLQIDVNMNGLPWNVSERHVTKALSELGITEDTYDFVLYVFPESINFEDNAALAYMN